MLDTTSRFDSGVEGQWGVYEGSAMMTVEDDGEKEKGKRRRTLKVEKAELRFGFFHVERQKIADLLDCNWNLSLTPSRSFVAELFLLEARSVSMEMESCVRASTSIRSETQIHSGSEAL